MKFVIQRVSKASCMVDGIVTGEINTGYLVLIGITGADTKEIADKMVHKMINLRIFRDKNGKTNLDLKTVNGELLLISQFTLYADCKKGNRPNFLQAAGAEQANALYEYIIEKCREEVEVVSTGIFGADMQIDLVNQGPFTIVLDSNEIL